MTKEQLRIQQKQLNAKIVEIYSEIPKKHEKTCFKDSHEECKLDITDFNEARMLAKEEARIGLQIIELERPGKENNPKWIEISTKLIDHYEQILKAEMLT